MIAPLNAGRRYVITGGMAQMPGLADLASQVLSAPVRVSCPPPIAGIAGGTAMSAFSGVIGLAMLAHSHGSRGPVSVDVAAPGGGYIAKVEHWLRESF
jgi:cell division protein FtsA